MEGDWIGIIERFQGMNLVEEEDARDLILFIVIQRSIDSCPTQKESLHSEK